MDQDEIQNVAFTIILHSGNSRTMVHEGFELMRNGEYEKAEEKLEEANKELTAAHQAQTSLMQKYTSGEDVNMDIIMVHAQDHLMTTMTLREVALEMLSLYQKVQK
ncbi:PTS cellobiose transporter subunit IIA [Tetragenococcus halophilus]|uniref:PTS cellobiose transporter subunit IIA n=1 Tax=Tetragenococcus halophilus TaxID=51669 RepID=UPI001F36F925|nr:PTS cellobiose transporter subunit IIA [Tetragenococcus halophilus]MDN5811377.1 PTS cellobiose transporter subunit IIA [Tetragenococcus koreensis]MDN6184995.1 PTS cellobiose transporter subunit IIA [Lactococcus lactis]MCF1602153.1 PTS cellobiose transporter subunit IIA [Tetragenococcus halophilus]MDN6271007.1 PTS cellobiose transporter subunit IIA [Tetragenococcus koreensis]MDN6391990.1 PTS cellobiose transporter subunit IIA [Lactococcus lactis]